MKVHLRCLHFQVINQETTLKTGFIKIDRTLVEVNIAVFRRDNLLDHSATFALLDVPVEQHCQLGFDLTRESSGKTRVKIRKRSSLLCEVKLSNQDMEYNHLIQINFLHASQDSKTIHTLSMIVLSHKLFQITRSLGGVNQFQIIQWM